MGGVTKFRVGMLRTVTMLAVPMISTGRRATCALDEEGHVRAEVDPEWVATVPGAWSLSPQDAWIAMFRGIREQEGDECDP